MVNMNEDFGAYKDSIWKGLTARELGVMAVSAVSCGIIIILLYFILGWNLYISFLIGTAVAAAIIFSQVWKSRSGLSAIEFYRARKYRKSTAKLVWKSDEYNQARKNYLKKKNNDREKSRLFIYLERMEQNGIFSNEEFIRYKKCTQPVYQTPASIQQMLDIAGVHENGIFEIEPNNGAGKSGEKFDRVYSFSDLNYVDQDKQQKDGILFQLRKFLNSMDTDFKITIQCEPRDVTNFQKSLLQDENKSEYPELARYNNEMIKKSLEKGQENVRKQRYLTVSANCRSIEEAEGWFDTFEHTALQSFMQWVRNWFL